MTDDDEMPFNKIENADYMAPGYFREEVLISTKDSTKDGIKRCVGDKSNAFDKKKLSEKVNCA